MNATPENIALNLDPETNSLTITINLNHKLPNSPKSTPNSTTIATTNGNHFLPLPNGQFSNLKLSLTLTEIGPTPQSHTHELLALAIKHNQTPPQLKPILTNIIESLAGYPKALANSLRHLQENPHKLSQMPIDIKTPVSHNNLYETTELE